MTWDLDLRRAHTHTLWYIQALALLTHRVALNCLNPEDKYILVAVAVSLFSLFKKGDVMTTPAGTGFVWHWDESRKRLKGTIHHIFNSSYLWYHLDCFAVNCSVLQISAIEVLNSLIAISTWTLWWTDDFSWGFPAFAWWWWDRFQPSRSPAQDL